MGKPGQRLQAEELAYIAKFYEYDGPVRLADALDLTINTVIKRYTRMQATRQVHEYRRMWDEQDVNRLERR